MNYAHKNLSDPQRHTGLPRTTVHRLSSGREPYAFATTSPTSMLSKVMNSPGS
jgi:hypothetical protein